MNPRIRTLVEKLRRIFQNFWHKNVFTLAAAVSYYAFLAIFPFFILLIYVSTVLFQRSLSIEKLEAHLKLFPPAVSDTIIANLDSIVSTGRVFSAISLIAVIYFAFRVFTVMESALDVIFESTESRSTWKANLKSFLFFLMTGFVLLILFFSGPTLFVLSKKVQELTFLDSYYLFLLSQIVVETIFFALTYKYLAHVKVPMKSALIGGFTATVLWELLKHIFGLYIVSIGLYELVYGSIGSLIILMLWIYWSILIYLFGAEVAADI